LENRRYYNIGIIITISLLVLLGSVNVSEAGISDGTVALEQKISDSVGDFTGDLDPGDFFGSSVVAIGDLDDDGVEDIAVGARLDDDGGTNKGAVWILFLNTDGTVKSHQKISNTAGDFTGVLDDGDGFGFSVAAIGDLNGDDIEDIAVGAPLDDDGGVSSSAERGAVWVLFLGTDGKVDGFQKISDTAGDFTGVLDDGDQFGSSVAAIEDLDGDDVGDIAVGSCCDDDGGDNHGAVWILFMESDGTTKADTDGFQKISDIEGEFDGDLDDGDFFGNSVAGIGDLNEVGV